MSFYDFIIAGGGASGLGLAYHMAQTNLRGRSILIVDREAKDRNDRTWSFWSDQPTRFDHLAYRTWEQIEIANENEQNIYDIRPYQYKMIRGIDFYEGMRETLSRVEGIEFMRGRVTDIRDTKDRGAAQVTVDDIPYGAGWAFDSTFKLADVISGPKGFHYLKQHFKGWEIETPTDEFDPRTVTMFDFRTPQQGAMRFFYILPFSKRRALVEYTLFSADLLKPHEYDRAIAEYIEKVRGITKYRIESVESGVIPMTDRPFPRRLGERVMAIGTKSGIVKPSSGYAFLRIQHDAAAITRSLVNSGHPFDVPSGSPRYRMYDSVMLQVMYRNGGMMKDIFSDMFRKNGPQTVFRFLDERSSLIENIPFLSSMPVLTFLKAFFKVKLLRRV